MVRGRSIILKTDTGNQTERGSRLWEGEGRRNPHTPVPTQPRPRISICVVPQKNAHVRIFLRYQVSPDLHHPMPRTNPAHSTNPRPPTRDAPSPMIDRLRGVLGCPSRSRRAPRRRIASPPHCAAPGGTHQWVASHSPTAPPPLSTVTPRDRRIPLHERGRTSR
jgi:hypothetical protein